jgi:hypothetical protein
MGWYGTENTTPAKDRAEMAQRWGDDLIASRVMDHGRAWWAVVRHGPYDGIAVLVQWQRSGGMWLHKTIDETFGPVRTDLPRALYDQLGKVPPGFAPDWRAKVRKRLGID